jgi:hypothetical protein
MPGLSLYVDGITTEKCFEQLVSKWRRLPGPRQRGKNA